MHCNIFHSEKSSSLYRSDGTAPTALTCFKDKPIEVKVPASKETATVAPHGAGVVMKIPPKSMKSTDRTVSFRTCSKSEHFVYPPGAELVGPIHHISINPTIQGDVEYLIEHNADIETSQEAKCMVVLVGTLSTDGSQKVQFKLEEGKFFAKKQHGCITTNHTGFLSVGTTQPSKMSKFL